MRKFVLHFVSSCLMLFTSYQVQAQIVINEVMARPGGQQGLIIFGGNSGNEYIELYNNGCTAVSVAGYFIGCRQDFAGIISGGGFRIPNVPAATIAPKGHLVLGTSTSSADPNSVDIKLPDYTANYCTNSPTTNFIMANADGWIGLYDAAGTPIDGLFWSSASSNITNAGNVGDFGGLPCVPAGSPGGVVLESAAQIFTGFPGVMNYGGVNPSVGLTYSRIPDGGAWQAGIAASINDLTLTPDNCNGGSCYTPVAAVTGFSYTTPVCATGTATPIPVAGFIPGGTYAAPAGVSINTSTGVINLATSTPGTYTITYTVVATPCSGAGNSSTSITINPTTAPITGFSYTSPICANATNPLPTTVAGFTTGGTYSSTPGLSINATTGLINLGASTPGAYTITYSVAASGCAAAGNSTASITINAVGAPVTSFSYTSPVCATGTSTPTLSAGFTAGGTFTSTAGLSINASTGVINLAASTPGLYTVNYAVAASGCNPAGNSNTNINITAIVVPVTGFSYASPICANATNPLPTTVAGFTTGGVYSSTPGLSINAGTGLINLGASTPGTYTITYSVAATGCNPAGNSTASITINAPGSPTTGFSYTSPVCANGTNPTPIPVAGFTAGGNYTAPAGVSINATTGIINLAASTPGTYTINYNVVATGCNTAGNSSTSITINPSVTPITGFSYSSPVCANGTNPSPTQVAGFTTGGVYSSTPGLSINAATGSINLGASTPGAYTVTYTVAISGCNPSGSSTASITITASTTPVTGFSYTSPVCANGTNPTPIPVAGFTAGGNYTAPAGVSINATTGVINLAASTPGTYSINYSVLASGCNPAGNSSSSITINPSVTPITGFSYTSPVCATGTNPAPTTVAGFTAGGVFSSTVGLSINAASGLINLAASTSGTYTVTYTVAANGCNPSNNSNATITITSTITPVTGFSYTSPICANASNPSPVPVAGFTTGGLYTAPAGLSINPSTGVINVGASTPGTYAVNYAITASGCTIAGNSSSSITINPVITPVTGFSYSSPVCLNGTNPAPTLVAGFATGGTFSSAAGLSINASTGVINLAASTAGTYTVNYAIAANGCTLAGNNTSNITLTATTIPVTGFSYTSPVCINATNPITNTVAGFTTGGTYSSTPGLSINPLTGVIDLATSTAGTYTVTYTVSAAGGCSVAGNSTSNITINPVPSAPTTTATVGYCQNAIANPLTATGTGLLWYTAATGGIGNANAPTPLTNTIGVTNYFVSQTNAGCESPRSTIAVTITAAPTPPTAISPIPYCKNDFTFQLNAIGNNLLWYTTPTGGIGSTSAPIPSSAVVGTTSYYVTQTVGNCESQTRKIDVIVAPLPTVNAGGPVLNIMEGQSVQLNGSAVGNILSFVWLPINNTTTLKPTVTPSNDITYTLAVLTQDGCRASDTVRVIVLKDLVVPNAFSPNGDGINEKWIIKYIDRYPEARVEVYNRYGQLLFRSIGYTTPWDGNYNGKPVPVGTYFWIINPGKGNTSTLKGSISIIR
ncbi:MAG: gliding motility-associated C-terminal domain-containing protein [Ferruginibacter sp.]